MPIVSMSLDEKTLRELDGLSGQLGFAGRSEALRAGVKKLVSENRELSRLSGKMKAVLLLVHGKEAEERATSFKHSYDDIVSTQVHTDLKEGKCLEIFVLEGEAGRIKEMVGQAQTNRKIDYCRLVVP
jgi:CopG family nickel-responsive transcriptional regulator